MADIRPFPAFRYNPEHVSPSDAVTQPYDKISPSMQDRYYAASPYNLVRIILGKPAPGDSEQENAYTRAAYYCQTWRQTEVLKQDSHPSLYYYTQRFTVPAGQVGSTGADIEFERRGFIALGRIHDYTDGVIFRHEQTLAKPKSDRLNLLRATRAHFGQIFMLYSDPAEEVDLLLENATLSVSPGGTRQSEADAAFATDPAICVTDEFGVLHRVWCISDPQVIEAVRSRMADKKLIIADGHHRYETALAYRNEQGGSPDSPSQFVMMTLVNMDSKGLVILPTHRVIHSLENFDRAKLLDGARKYFEVVPVTGKCDDLMQRLSDAGRHGTTILANSGDDCFLLHAREGAADSILKDVPPLQRQLDVVHLHKVLLEHVLGLSEESIRQQQNISYQRNAADAVSQVRKGANVAFLMNPIKMDQLREITFAGGVLPQKSTDFYPKLLSGLTVYAL